MKTKKIVIKYHNLKMLLTVDMNKLIETILKLYGEYVHIDFIIMTDKERKKSSETNGMLTLVKERFWIFENDKNREFKRRIDIEQKVEKEGIK